jgi:hypothetical protein
LPRRDAAPRQALASNLAFTSGSASAFTTSACGPLTMAAGVPAGAISVNQELNSKAQQAGLDD